jgi:hypothetical protein
LPSGDHVGPESPSATGAGVVRWRAFDPSGLATQMLAELPEPTTRAAIGHALAFTTWRSLTGEQGLEDAQAVDLMCDFVASAAHPGK